MVGIRYDRKKLYGFIELEFLTYLSIKKGLIKKIPEHKQKHNGFRR